MAIKWGRGFFRIWLVFAALWLGGAAWDALTDTSIPSATKSCSVLLHACSSTGDECFTQDDVKQCEAVWSKERRNRLIWALVPPIALLVAGLTIGWIVRGFKTA